MYSRLCVTLSPVTLSDEMPKHSRGPSVPLPHSPLLQTLEDAFGTRMQIFIFFVTWIYSRLRVTLSPVTLADEGARHTAQEKLKPLMNLSPRAKQVIQGGVQDGLKRVRHALDVYGFVCPLPCDQGTLPLMGFLFYRQEEVPHLWQARDNGRSAMRGHLLREITKNCVLERGGRRKKEKKEERKEERKVGREGGEGWMKDGRQHRK